MRHGCMAPLNTSKVSGTNHRGCGPAGGAMAGGEMTTSHKVPAGSGVAAETVSRPGSGADAAAAAGTTAGGHIWVFSADAAAAAARRAEKTGA